MIISSVVESQVRGYKISSISSSKWIGSKDFFFDTCPYLWAKFSSYNPNHICMTYVLTYLFSFFIIGNLPTFQETNTISFDWKKGQDWPFQCCQYRGRGPTFWLHFHCWPLSWWHYRQKCAIHKRLLSWRGKRRQRGHASFTYNELIIITGVRPKGEWALASESRCC